LQNSIENSTQILKPGETMEKPALRKVLVPCPGWEGGGFLILSEGEA